MNHAATVQLEQAADVRKYLKNISGEFGSSVSEVSELLADLEEGPQGSDSSVAKLIHTELRKLHARNLNLERKNAEATKAQALQQAHILKQDRWVKQLSNVVANLSQKLEAKGIHLRELIQSQVETTNQLNQSESTLVQLSQVNKDLFSKLKHAMAGIGGGRGPAGGDMLQKVMGENFQLKSDLALAREQLGTEDKHGQDKSQMRARIQKLETEVKHLNTLRKNTNKRAHQLAQEKQTLVDLSKKQKETIASLRRQLDFLGLKPNPG